MIPYDESDLEKRAYDFKINNFKSKNIYVTKIIDFRLISWLKKDIIFNDSHIKRKLF